MVLASARYTAQLVQHAICLEPWAPGRETQGPSAAYAYQIMALHPRRASWGHTRGQALRRFVGRSHEFTFLHERLQQVEGGEGQVVGLIGEPGLGKSRLLYEFLHGLEAGRVTYLEGRCISYGRVTPYLPVLDLVRQYCGITEADVTEMVSLKIRQRLREVEIEPNMWTPYLLHLLGLSVGTEALAELTPALVQTRTFEVLWQMMLVSSHVRPLILAVEDLHWIDAASEACLASLVERLAGAPILCLLAYRPGYRPPWIERSYATQMALSRLTPHDSLSVVHDVLGAAQCPDAVVQTILAKAQGNPFFLEELTHSVVEQGPRHAATVVPDTVQAVLAARLDRLLPEAKRLLQAAAVIGHEVPLPVLQAITACPSEVLHRSVHHLQVAECLVETRLHPERIYTFKHALTQEVAYQSLVQHTRQRYHAQVAQVLVEHFPETVEAQPERVAHHYTAAGLGAQAVPYWHQAGQRAMARSASAEAISHLTHGIEILQTLPVTPERTQQELRLQITLGTPLRRLQGNKASEVERVYARALEMYRQVEDSPQRFEALTGLWSFAMERGRASMARDLAEQGCALAQRLHNPEILQEAYTQLGTVLYYGRRVCLSPDAPQVQYGFA